MNVCEQTFHISHVRISHKVKGFNVKCSTYYFHMETKILADFQICISVPLNQIAGSTNNLVWCFKNESLGARKE